MSTRIDIPVAGPHPTKTKLQTFAESYLILLQWVHVLTLVARNIGGALAAPIGHPWARYYQRVALVEEGVVMPHSTLTFIISGLFAFVEIKSQSEPGFPFKTHPYHARFSIVVLLVYGFACALELIVSAAGLHRTSVFAIIARLGKLGSLCILVTSLACLFFF